MCRPQMPRAGIHPMRSLVRVVLTNGASINMQLAYQTPYPGVQVTTKFLEVDHLTHENFTGTPSRLSRKVGQRAKFENKFSGAASSAEDSQK